ncbi:MAG: PTS sugar transporter subunit IIC [Erysipelotrichaceae bacterium]|nr:PTS sugar transporter subunit IIC [Erysipelotrichaceae bacterium]
MKKLLDFIAKTSSGMALGLFATLIVGTILKQLFSIGNGFQIGIDIATTLMNLMGLGIALGVSLSIDKNMQPLELISLCVLGGVSSSINLEAPNRPIPTFTINGGSKNPLHIYLVIIFTILLVKKLLIKKTPIDILLIPLIYIFVGSVIGFILIYPSYYLIYVIQLFIETSMPLIPFIMSIIISVIMGMILTMPISSVAVCVAISIGNVPLAAGAAVIGCSVQMIGFATQSFRAKNPLGKTISVGIGTSMLYWPNIIKKPSIWLPTIITSIILGPIGVCLLNTTSTSAGAGMGSCGLVGQMSVIETMGATNPLTWVSIIGIQVIGTIILTIILDYIFKDKLHLYSNEDLKLN